MKYHTYVNIPKLETQQNASIISCFPIKKRSIIKAKRQSNMTKKHFLEL